MDSQRAAKKYTWKSHALPLLPCPFPGDQHLKELTLAQSKDLVQISQLYTLICVSLILQVISYHLCLILFTGRESLNPAPNQGQGVRDGLE